MRDDHAAEPQDLASRQICAYLDGAAHHARYKRAWIEHPGRHYRIDVPTVLGTLALFPFLQALSTALGTTAGEKTVEGLRAVAGKVLRRELTAADVNEQQPDSPSIAGVARVQFDEDVPPEALQLLPAVNFSPLRDLGDYPPVVRWLTDGKWHAVTLHEGQIVDATWEAVENRMALHRHP
ncbi:hypothetical protein ACGFYM_40630 [Streptomyces sp. NPDC048231]|uniref:hypothetical protein n=1 Tax=Streptomyces sp. NPDC048231 TaxID=3365519 RepID=UPI003721687E